MLNVLNMFCVFCAPVSVLKKVLFGFRVFLAVSESVSSEYDHNFWSGNFRLLQEVSGGFSSPGVEGRSFRCLISRIPDLQSPGALSTQLYVSFYELLCQCACLRERRS